MRNRARSHEPNARPAATQEVLVVRYRTNRATHIERARCDRRRCCCADVTERSRGDPPYRQNDYPIRESSPSKGEDIGLAGKVWLASTLGGTELWRS